jgi:hypothetical protein
LAREVLKIRMMSPLRPRIALAGLALLSALAVHASEITSSSQLDGILGGGESLDTFETFNIPFGGQINSGTPLTSTSIFDGQGPGLVLPGADFSAQTLYAEGNGYFDLNTQTLGDSSVGGPITITFTSPVDAFGFDMQAYSGYGEAGSISVYDSSNSLISTTLVNGGYFGWENAGGIDSVVISANPADYIMIDNVGFGNPGNSNAPAPDAASSAAMLGFVLTGIGFIRRKSR